MALWPLRGGGASLAKENVPKRIRHIKSTRLEDMREDIEAALVREVMDKPDTGGVNTPGGEAAHGPWWRRWWSAALERGEKLASTLPLLADNNSGWQGQGNEAHSIDSTQKRGTKHVKWSTQLVASKIEVSNGFKNELEQPITNVHQSLKELVMTASKWIMLPYTVYEVFAAPFRIAFPEDAIAGLLPTDVVVDLVAFIDITRSVWEPRLSGEEHVLAEAMHPAVVVLNAIGICLLWASRPLYNAVKPLWHTAQAIRMVRYIQMNQHLARCEDDIQTNYTLVLSFKYFILTIGHAHVIGCLWWAMAEQQAVRDKAGQLSFSEESWVMQYFLRSGNEDFNPHTNETWQKYLLSFFFGMCGLITLGYGNVTIRTMPEIALLTLTCQFQIVFYAHVLGTIFHVLFRTDEDVKKFKGAMRAVNSYSTMRQLSFTLHRRLAAHFEFQFKKSASMAKGVFQQLPVPLLAKTSYNSNCSHVMQSKLFSGCNDQFQYCIIVSLTVRYLMPLEVLFRQNDASRELFFCTDGSMHMRKDARFIRTVQGDSNIGTIVGDVAFILGVQQPHTVGAVGSGDVALLVLTKADFETHLLSCPEQVDVITSNLLKAFDLDKQGKYIQYNASKELEEDELIEYEELKLLVAQATIRRNEETLAQITFAASEGDVDTVRMLAARGLDINAGDYDNRTTLHLAAAEGNAKVVSLLIELEADPNVTDRWGGTPLRDAVHEGHDTVCTLLREAGASLSLDDPAGVLCTAASKGQLDYLSMLLANGVDINSHDYDRRSALHLAASEGKARVVEFLIQNHANVNCMDRFNQTPIDDAIAHRETSTATVLRDNGGKANKDKSAARLVVAIEEGDVEMLDVLAKAGVDLNQPNYDGRTALHHAALHGQLVVVDFLTYHKSEVNAIDRWFHTPIVDALSHDRMEVAILLYWLGSRPHQSGPLNLIVEEGMQRIARLPVIHITRKINGLKATQRSAAKLLASKQRKLKVMLEKFAGSLTKLLAVVKPLANSLMLGVPRWVDMIGLATEDPAAGDGSVGSSQDLGSLDSCDTFEWDDEPDPEGAPGGSDPATAGAKMQTAGGDEKLKQHANAFLRSFTRITLQVPKIGDGLSALKAAYHQHLKISEKQLTDAGIAIADQVKRVHIDAIYLLVKGDLCFNATLARAVGQEVVNSIAFDAEGLVPSLRHHVYLILLFSSSFVEAMASLTNKKMGAETFGQRHGSCNKSHDELSSALLHAKVSAEREVLSAHRRGSAMEREAGLIAKEMSGSLARISKERRFSLTEMLSRRRSSSAGSSRRGSQVAWVLGAGGRYHADKPWQKATTGDKRILPVLGSSSNSLLSLLTRDAQYSTAGSRCSSATRGLSNHGSILSSSANTASKIEPEDVQKDREELKLDESLSLDVSGTCWLIGSVFHTFDVFGDGYVNVKEIKAMLKGDDTVREDAGKEEIGPLLKKLSMRFRESCKKGILDQATFFVAFSLWVQESLQGDDTPEEEPPISFHSTQAAMMIEDKVRESNERLAWDKILAAGKATDEKVDERSGQAGNLASLAVGTCECNLIPASCGRAAAIPAEERTPAGGDAHSGAEAGTDSEAEAEAEPGAEGGEDSEEVKDAEYHEKLMAQIWTRRIDHILLQIRRKKATLDSTGQRYAPVDVSDAMLLLEDAKDDTIVLKKADFIEWSDEVLGIKWAGSEDVTWFELEMALLERRKSSDGSGGAIGFFTALQRIWSSQSDHDMPWYILDHMSPAAIWLKYMNAVVATYYFIAVPIRIAFLPRVLGMEAIAIADYTCDAMCYLQIVASFVTQYTNKKGTVVANMKKIRRHYLSTRFCWDAVATFPLDLITLAIITGEQGHSLSAWIRLPRLMHLLNLYEVQASWHAHFEEANARTVILKHTMMMVFLVHYGACAWSMLGFDSAASNSWSNRWPVHFYDVSSRGFDEIRVEHNLDSWSLTYQWLTCAFWMMAMLAAQGHNVVYSNFAEVVFAIFVSVLNLTAYAIMVGEFSTLVMKRDEQKLSKRNYLQAVEQYLCSIALPLDLVEEIREHFRDTADGLNSQATDGEILSSLPLPLKVDIKRTVCKATVNRTIALDGCDNAFVDAFCVQLNEASYERGQIIYRTNEVSQKMYIVKSGEVEVYVSNAASDSGLENEVVHLKAINGDAIGEIAFVFNMRHSNNARSSADGGAVTFEITREDYCDLLKLFPEQDEVVMRNIVREWDAEGYTEVDNRSAKSKGSRGSKGTKRSSHSGENKGKSDDKRSARSKGASSLVDSTAIDNDAKIYKQIREAKAKREDEYTVRLCDACARGNLEEVQRLVLHYEVNVNLGDYDKRTPLHLAASEGHTAVLKFLLHNIADVNQRDRYEGSALTDAIREGQVDAARILREYGASFNSESMAEKVCAAAARGDVSKMKKLIENGVEVGLADYDGRTPLHLASAEGHIHIVELLLESKASLAAVDRFGQTPLQDAYRHEQFEVSELLLNKGGKLGTLDSANKLCTAASKGNAERIKSLVYHKCDINAHDHNGRTCLHLAASTGHVLVCHLLLNPVWECNINVLDHWGNTPLDDAERHGHRVIVLLLEENGGKKACDVISAARECGEKAGAYNVLRRCRQSFHEELELKEDMERLIDAAISRLTDERNSASRQRKIIMDIMVRERRREPLSSMPVTLFDDMRAYLGSSLELQKFLTDLKSLRQTILKNNVVMSSHALESLIINMDLNECLQQVDKIASLAADYAGMRDPTTAMEEDLLASASNTPSEVEESCTRDTTSSEDDEVQLSQAAADGSALDHPA